MLFEQLFRIRNKWRRGEGKGFATAINEMAAEFQEILGDTLRDPENLSTEEQRSFHRSLELIAQTPAVTPSDAAIQFMLAFHVLEYLNEGLAFDETRERRCAQRLVGSALHALIKIHDIDLLEFGGQHFLPPGFSNMARPATSDTD